MTVNNKGDDTIHDDDKKLFQSIMMSYDPYKTPHKTVSYNNNKGATSMSYNGCNM